LKEFFDIPFSKPDIDNQEIEAITEVLKSGWPSQGKITEDFSNELSKYLSANVSVVNNGSSALMSALIANDIKPGDKIIVPALTYVATASIPKMLGVNLIVADIDPFTLNMNPEKVEELLKKHDDVKAIILVDVGGLPSDIESFTEISQRYKIKLIEDAAQAFGSEYRNKKIGSFEHTTIFSFQITKQITTIEGGCVTSNDDQIIKKINKIKDYGRSEHGRYIHDLIGTNFRTTDIQSAMGIVQLQKVEKHIARRIKISNEYKRKITDFEFQKIPKYVSRHSNLIFFAISQNKEIRDNYIKNLIEKKIDARPPWNPIHKQPCFPDLENFDCKIAEKIFEKTLMLPIYNSMTLLEAQTVIDCVKENK